VSADHRTAEEIVSDPAWEFAINPAKAVQHATTRAAQAFREHHNAEAHRWASVARRLIVLAANPNIQAGAVLAGLAANPKVRPPQ
jgi:hypothetical protein